ncbi:MAG: type II secretion system protein [Verrucomicrobiia bacterium]
MRTWRPMPPAGIALLELMLATAIMGIALIALGIAVGRCVRGLTATEHLRGALDALEQALVERELSASVEGEVKMGTFEGERVTPRGPIKWEQRVETTDDPEILRSTWIVRWSEGGRPRERSFVGLVARKPLRVAGLPVPNPP